MKTYEISITYIDCRTIWVDAESEDAAEAEALRQIARGSIDDSGYGVCDVSHIEEVTE